MPAARLWLGVGCHAPTISPDGMPYGRLFKLGFIGGFAIPQQSLPPGMPSSSGCGVTCSVTEGACVSVGLHRLFGNALSPTRYAGAPSRRGPRVGCPHPDKSKFENQLNSYALICRWRIPKKYNSENEIFSGKRLTNLFSCDTIPMLKTLTERISVYGSQRSGGWCEPRVRYGFSSSRVGRKKVAMRRGAGNQ